MIPITVVTGFLGAGKTSLILSLLPKLPRDYKVVLLKNEFGDVAVDSKLAEQSNLAGVNEILNGCMCCILVGQIHDACLEIRDKFAPDRIIIEASGSAFPATLAFQIRELERQTDGAFGLDAIVTVIDAENFLGYEDTSPTAKMQSSYSDVIVINKWEAVSERQLDTVMDHIFTLNEHTPKVRSQGKSGVDPKLIFGLESKLFLEKDALHDAAHNDEVQTLTLSRTTGQAIDQALLVQALSAVSKESVWRIKGFVRLTTGQTVIVNWAFGRSDFIPLEKNHLEEEVMVKMTVMGERDEVRRRIQDFAGQLDCVAH